LFPLACMYLKVDAKWHTRYQAGACSGEAQVMRGRKLLSVYSSRGTHSWDGLAVALNSY